MAEVRHPDRRWSVAPPVVTRLPGGSGIGILTGSRTPALDLAIDAAAERAGVDVRRIATAGAPSTIVLSPRDSTALECLAQCLDAVFVPCAAQQLAAALAPISSFPRHETWAPDRSADQTRRFDVAALDFRAGGEPPSFGLVEASSFGQTRYLFGDADGWRAVPRSLGIYLELRRTGQQAIDWSPERGGTLRVPLRARLPTLQARAATLCAGVLPGSADNPWLRYENVPSDVAKAICRSVMQPGTGQ
jgi:hypothetical protein